MTEHERRSAFPPTLTEKVAEQMRLRVNSGEFTTGILPSIDKLAKEKRCFESYHGKSFAAS